MHRRAECECTRAFITYVLTCWRWWTPHLVKFRRPPRRTGGVQIVRGVQGPSQASIIQRISSSTGMCVCVCGHRNMCTRRGWGLVQRFRDITTVLASQLIDTIYPRTQRRCSSAKPARIDSVKRGLYKRSDAGPPH